MGAYHFGQFVLDTDTHELLRSGQPLHLSPKAFRLLEALVSTRPRAWSKAALQDLLWPNTTVVEANLPNLVKELRAVLGDDAERPRYLRTIHRFGYAFLDSSGMRSLPGLLQTAMASATGFVGRGAELARMNEAWRRAQAAHRQLVLIAGEPGIGKTRLLGEFCRRCYEAGALTLVGRCDEEALIPYQPFVEALSQFVDSCTDLELDRLISASVITPDLARIIPAVARRFPALLREPVVDPESERFRLFNAVDAMVSSASRRSPVVVVLDDLHWADKSSLLMLRHLARGDTASAVCLIGTYRDSELRDAHPLSELLADLRRIAERKQSSDERWVEGTDLRLVDEVRYIQRRAAENSGRIVTIGPLLLFSTESGDAWILDPADHLATRIAEGGDPRPVHIEETEMSFAVGWQGRYETVGPAFVFTDRESGRVATTLGYPTREIADRIAAVWVSGGR